MVDGRKRSTRTHRHDSPTPLQLPLRISDPGFQLTAIPDFLVNYFIFHFFRPDKMLAQTLLSAVVLALADHALAVPTLGPKLVARQGYIANCTETYTVQLYDNCNKIRDNFNDGFTLADFYSWNPQVDSFCSNLFPGEVVCVSVGDPAGPVPACPVPVKAGLAADCDSCYEVAEGDSCLAILSANDITLAELRAWNPDLNSVCTNLEIGFNYCVGVSGGDESA
ncbi:hypothetical protein F5Y14DRAFT_301723 [Nemania sp. NC0429]|nr:hypothetical protein F5Y14DRAFT_301723 [Nemania sp. NC0429]